MTLQDLLLRLGEMPMRTNERILYHVLEKLLVGLGMSIELDPSNPAGSGFKIVDVEGEDITGDDD